MSTLRVLFVAPLDWESSGIGLYSHTIAGALEDEGVEVVRTPLRTRSAGGDLNANDSLTFAPELRRRATEASTDLVHLQYEPGLMSRASAIALARQPPPGLVVTLHRVPAYTGLWTLKGLRQRKAVWMERSLARAARALLVHSQHTAAIVKERYPRVPCIVQSMPVPLDPCSGARKPGNYVLFFGHQHPGKGLLDLVKAMRRLPDIQCVVSGPRDPRWSRFTAKVDRQAQHSPNVEIESGWAPVERKHQLFRGASAVVLPYRVGGFASAVLQDAIAHERPVVVSSVEPLADTVRRSGIGEIARAGDATALARAVAHVSQEVSSDREAALRRAKEDGAPTMVARRLKDTYATVIG